MLLPVLLTAQRTGSKEVTGKVTDNSGKPLSGVTVNVRSTKVFASTNDDGIFKIEERGNDVLVFSSASYKSQEVRVTTSSVYNITMVTSVSTLNDVVVIGYGNINRRNLSSAITTVKPEDFNKGAITDVGQLLQGKVTGLNITASGDPAGTVILPK